MNTNKMNVIVTRDTSKNNMDIFNPNAIKEPMVIIKDFKGTLNDRERNLMVVSEIGKLLTDMVIKASELNTPFLYDNMQKCAIGIGDFISSMAKTNSVEQRAIILSSYIKSELIKILYSIGCESKNVYKISEVIVNNINHNIKEWIMVI